MHDAVVAVLLAIPVGLLVNWFLWRRTSQRETPRFSQDGPFGRAFAMAMGAGLGCVAVPVVLFVLWIAFVLFLWASRR